VPSDTDPFLKRPPSFGSKKNKPWVIRNLHADRYIFQLNEMRLMHVGSNYSRLEKRITQSLESPGLNLREASFLQELSEKIGIYRADTLISDSAAKWLFNILNRGETFAQKNKRAGARPVAGRSPRKIPPAGLAPIDLKSVGSAETRPEPSPQKPVTSSPPDRATSTPRPLPDAATVILRSLENSQKRRQRDFRLQEEFKRGMRRS
jgi:hypothetical protein